MLLIIMKKLRVTKSNRFLVKQAAEEQAVLDEIAAFEAELAAELGQ